MDTTSQRRILRLLAEAKGDLAQLALVSVNLAHPDLSQSEVERLREALLAAAVPHWFDAAFLASLLDTSLEEANVLMNRLQALSNIEDFPARGPDACNVHEASRLPLREHLRTTQHALWQRYSKSARDHAATGSGMHHRIETLYHQFAADPITAATDCDALDRELGQDPAKRSALCLALGELVASNWLNGAALAEALRVSLWYRSSRGQTSHLEKEARELLTLALKHSPPSCIADVHCLMGEVHVAQGELALAHAAFTEASRIARELTDQTPKNTSWQRDLAVFLSKLGDVVAIQGDLTRALILQSENKKILEQIALGAPADAASQRELAVAFNKLGDIAQSQGDLDGAKSSFKGAVSILEGIAISEQSNTIWQRDLAISQARLGDIAMRQGDLPSALHYFSIANDVTERLAACDPENAAHQSDLSVSLAKLGNVMEAQGKIAKALNYINEAKKILVVLANSAPTNSVWQRELSATLNKLGDLARAKGDLPVALLHYSESHAICAKLAASDPTNTLWQQDLSTVYYLMAIKVYAPQKRWLRALNLMERSLEIDERLAAKDSSIASWQSNVGMGRDIVADLRKRAGKK
jgi:tetratricopeptide (TPR) repeat protein